jgi:hypothetical protein
MVETLQVQSSSDTQLTQAELYISCPCSQSLQGKGVCLEDRSSRHADTNS